MRNKIGEIRPGQLITTFGPGSIIDSVDDSVMILDINYWTNADEKIKDKRLAKFLKKDFFKKVPSSNKGDLPVFPFPFYHVCSNNKCRHLFDIRDTFKQNKTQKIKDYLENGPKCPLCTWKAYPSRFVISCPGNHLDDFPWRWWAHGKEETKCNGKLTLTSTSFSSGLESLIVKCECMEKGKSLAGAMSEQAFEGYYCTEYHPHRLERVKEKECKGKVIPLQRGASNVYFAALRSAITISEDDPMEEFFSENKSLLLEREEDFGVEGLKKYYERINDNNLFGSFENFLSSWHRYKNSEVSQDYSYNQIKEIEYNRFVNFNGYAKIPQIKPEFEAESQIVPDDLKQYFSRIVQVHRLKEIMVLLGFMRNDSPEPEVEYPKNIIWLNSMSSKKWGSQNQENWLPAVEIHGEGIFLEFNKSTIEQWLTKVVSKSEYYAELYKDWVQKKGWSLLENRNALYVMMHTLSHLLIKQLSLKSGYSSVAIKERIYCGENMAGILLYTGSLDQEGSLGGLVEMGKINKFRSILKDALEDAIFCTNDPVCSSININEENDLNGSACFACSMIAETSCEFGNHLLDRSLLVPLLDSGTEPYFEGLI